MTKPQKDGITWLKPGIVGRVRHLRGEDKLRLAPLMDVRNSR